MVWLWRLYAESWKLLSVLLRMNQIKALDAGIMFVLCRGCLAMVLESDSQVLVNALFSHVKRQGNMPAHLVAKNAYSFVNDIVCIEEDPCFAKQALIHDLMVS
nr:hypothetical protein CFP56_22085 [Quercus suber]